MDQQKKPIKAIPQVHRGTVYRSRTEARWAEFLFSVGARYSYESNGYDLGSVRYLPDFWLPFPEIHIEVKGEAPSAFELKKARLLAEQSGNPVVLVIDNPSTDGEYILVRPNGENQRCFFVEEHKLGGAWIAEFADGGGWAFPLAAGLVNCAAYGHQHPLLDKAGAHQFDHILEIAPDKPPMPARAPDDWQELSRATWKVFKSARDRMKKGDE
jgi:hypothetical protein